VGITSNRVGIVLISVRIHAVALLIGLHRTRAIGEWAKLTLRELRYVRMQLRLITRRWSLLSQAKMHSGSEKDIVLNRNGRFEASRPYDLRVIAFVRTLVADGMPRSVL
jgi:hypothetical protein